MSKCISNLGEFSEHEYTGNNATCDYCGQVSEMIAVHQLQNMRAALVAIQELAVGFQDWNPMDSRDAGEVYPASSVEDLLDDIRRLADDALGGDNNG